MGTASCIALHPARRKPGSWLHLTTLFLLLVLLAWQLPLSAADPLILGVFPRRDAATSAQLFQPLADYLETSLQRPVTLELSADFDVFISNLRQRRYDLVHLNQFDYVMAHDELKYDALVQNEEFGEKTIKGAVYVRKDSGLTRLDELKGKKILFGGGPRAMMSYVVPTYLLRRAGLVAGDYEEVYAINPPNAVLATYLGRADAGGAGEVVRRLPLVTSKIDVNQLDLIAISDPLPHLPWAVKSEMNADLKARIQTLLVDLKATEEGARILKKARLTALNPVTDKDYDAHRLIIDYINEH
ncbi:MAG: phosphate/phosphite/phosphonate ABC transporter substrate-binding protein [Candidatus Thiodiazotropha sp.]